MERTKTNRPPRNAVDPRSVSWWRTRLVLIFGVLILVLGMYSVIPGLFKLGGTWLLIPTVLVAIFAVPACLLLPRWWYRVHRWEVTETAVYLRTGYFWQESRAAPLSRIQSVDVLRGPLQKRFGLATVAVATASAKGALKIEGLDSERADDLAGDITTTTRRFSPSNGPVP